MLTLKQSQAVDYWRDKGVPAEWAILTARRSDTDFLNEVAHYDRFSDWLWDAFWWEATPEGYEFWRGVVMAVTEETAVGGVYAD